MSSLLIYTVKYCFGFLLLELHLLKVALPNLSQFSRLFPIDKRSHTQKYEITGGHMKSGQHFKVTFLPYYGTEEEGCYIILKLIQNAIDLSNIKAVIRNGRELSNNT